MYPRSTEYVGLHLVILKVIISLTSSTVSGYVVFMKNSMYTVCKVQEL